MEMKRLDEITNDLLKRSKFPSGFPPAKLIFLLIEAMKSRWIFLISPFDQRSDAYTNNKRIQNN